MCATWGDPGKIAGLAANFGIASHALGAHSSHETSDLQKADLRVSLVVVSVSVIVIGFS